MLDLPSPAIDLLSSEGQELLKEAMSDRTADGFRMMFSVGNTQSKLTTCGLSSLSNVLNALRIDLERSLMGVWRRYSEEMLVDAEMSKKIEKEGITFKELAEVACRQEVEVEAFQTNQCSVELFREKVKKATSSPISFIIACYSRGILSQKGDGHFSPLVAYHARRDMVLIIDVASFKYPPHWIPFNLSLGSNDSYRRENRRTERVYEHLKEDSIIAWLEYAIKEDNYGQNHTEYQNVVHSEFNYSQILLPIDSELERIF